MLWILELFFSSLIFSHQSTFISSLIIFNPAHSLLYKKKCAGFHSEFAFPRTWNMRVSFAFVTSILETFQSRKIQFYYQKKKMCLNFMSGKIYRLSVVMKRNVCFGAKRCSFIILSCVICMKCVCSCLIKSPISFLEGQLLFK